MIRDLLCLPMASDLFLILLHAERLDRLNGLSYSKFMYGLKLAGVELNRKVLADMAVNDAQGFASLVELAKSKLA